VDSPNLDVGRHVGRQLTPDLFEEISGNDELHFSRQWAMIASQIPWT
jgi:hypothetical protein